MYKHELLNFKSPIYFPVYAGFIVFLKLWNKYPDRKEKETSLYNNASFEVWNKHDDKKYFYYPYALFSSYHNQKSNLVNDYKMNKKDVLLFSDSGGFQVSTGVAKNWDQEKSLRWAEENCSITPLLDIPITTKRESFHSALEKTMANAKWVKENRKTDELNVLNVVSGTNYTGIRKWLDETTKNEFEGWAHGGGVTKVSEYLFPILYLIDKGIYSRDMKTPMIHHIFGVSNVYAFLFISFIQNQLYKREIPVQITFDSSLASISTSVSKYVTNFSLDGLRRINISGNRDPILKQKFEEWAKAGIGMFCCDCPVCRSIPNISDIVNEDFYTRFSVALNYHNLYYQIRHKNMMDFIVQTESWNVVDELLPSKCIKALKLIETMFNDVHNVIKDKNNTNFMKLKEYEKTFMNSSKKGSGKTDLNAASLHHFMS